jgi:hypothetical protein
VGPLAEDNVSGKRVDFHVFDLSGSTAADVVIVDPSAPFHIGQNDAKLWRQFEMLEIEHNTWIGIWDAETGETYFKRCYYGGYSEVTLKLNCELVPRTELLGLQTIYRRSINKQQCCIWSRECAWYTADRTIAEESFPTDIPCGLFSTL